MRFAVPGTTGGLTSGYDHWMAIKAQLAGSESMRVPAMGRAPGTARRCPACMSTPGEFCRELLTDHGVTPMRVGGYVIEVHPERIDDPLPGRAARLLPRQSRTDSPSAR